MEPEFGHTDQDLPALEPESSGTASHSVELLKVNLRSRETIPAVASDLQGRTKARPEQSSRADSHDAYDYEPVGRPRWPVVMLASYASAVTLALLWFVVLARWKGKPSVGVDDLPTPTAGADDGVRSALSRKINPARPVPDEHMTVPGKPLVIGSLEFTPLDVLRRPVVLLRMGLVGGEERKEETGQCLVLRFRLRNISENLIFAPYDESFVRDQDPDIADSFVEFGPNVRVYPFPLAKQSEWSIEGQSFRELKPGETLDTLFVTSPESDNLTSNKLKWRLRLRTGLNQTDLVGVTTDVPEP